MRCRKILHCICVANSERHKKILKNKSSTTSIIVRLLCMETRRDRLINSNCGVRCTKKSGKRKKTKRDTKTIVQSVYRARKLHTDAHRLITAK